MRRFLPRPRRRDRGAVIPMVALSLTMLMTMTAFAVDLGRMRTERRDLQADADAIAMDAVQAIRGLTGAPAQAAAVAEANASAQRNDLDMVLAYPQVQVGRWDVGAQQFQFTGDDANAALVPNAVFVDLSETVDMFFDFSQDERQVSRWAVAVSRAQVKGELGSVVAGIEPKDPTAGCAIGASASMQMTLMNHLYAALFGITVGVDSTVVIEQDVDENQSCQVIPDGDGLKLDVVSYQGLASSRVLFEDLAAELGAGSPDELADTMVTQSELLCASGKALQREEDEDGNVDTSTLRYAVGTQLIAMAEAIVESREPSDPATEVPGPDCDPQAGADTESDVRFGDAFQSSSGGDPALDTSMSALDMVFLAATMIDGQNFVGGETGISVPLPLGVNGANVDVPVRFHVIEPPVPDTEWKYQGDDGPRTSQVSIALDVPINLSGLPVPLNTLLSIVGLGSPHSSSLGGSIPLVIELGRATSRYTQVDCPKTDASPSTVKMEVASGAARVSVGATTDTDFSNGVAITTPGKIVAEGSASVKLLSLLPVTVDAHVAGDLPSITQRFTSAVGSEADTGLDLNAGGDIEDEPPFLFTPPGPTAWQRYAGGFGGISSSTGYAMFSREYNFTSSGAIGTLSPADSKTVRRELVRQSVKNVLDRVDAQVLEPLANALGVTVGGADARILDVRCEVPALANRP